MAISISYDSRLIGDVTRDHIFNAPVGACQDLNENIWCADTGNSRVLIYNSKLDQLLGEISDLRALTHPLPWLCPSRLNMPFRMARHSGNKWIYLTDIGNCSILVLDYSAGYGCDDLKVKLVFQQPADAPCIIHPNGIAFGTYNGRNYVAVADEFRHDGNPDKRNRICLYDEDGSYSGRFESVTNGSSAIDLYWPQGLAADSDGLLYICNVGYGVMQDPGNMGTATVVRCQPTAAGTGVPFPNSHYPVPGIPQVTT